VEESPERLLDMLDGKELPVLPKWIDRAAT
jgi:hypothetical protein